MTQQERSMFNCPVEATLSLIGGKYKPIILWHLIKEPLHYMELQRLIPGATPKMLSQQLRGLETSGMISREVIPEKPPRTISFPDRIRQKHYSGAGCDVYLGNGLFKRAECENTLSEAGEGMSGGKDS